MPRALTPEEKRIRITEKANDEREGIVRTAAERASGTRKRKSFNGTTGKLVIEQSVVDRFTQEGWHLRIINDTPGRISQALEAGYEFVTPQEIGDSLNEGVTPRNTSLDDSKVRFLVGQTDGGEFAFLMKQPMEYYLEDTAELERRNDMVDEAIRSGKNVKAGTSADGFYNAGISMNAKLE